MSWLRSQVDWLKGFASEKDGKASNKRLSTLLIIGVFCWSYLKIAWAAQTLLDIPTNWSLLLPTLLGLSIWANKVAKDKDSSNNAG